MRAALGQLALFAMVIAALGCDSRSHGPRRDVGATADGGTTIPPTGCVSSRICADRLDCEDGERCNTALAEPVCQRIRCGPAGSACSDGELCVAGLACLGGVCSEGFDAATACRSACEQGVRGGCVTESCDTMCADAQAQYDEARTNAEIAGCLPQFDVFLSCAWSGDICDSSRCEAQASAYVDCFSGFCADNPDSSACSS